MACLSGENYGSIHIRFNIMELLAIRIMNRVEEAEEESERERQTDSYMYTYTNIYIYIYMHVCDLEVVHGVCCNARKMSTLRIFQDSGDCRRSHSHPTAILEFGNICITVFGEGEPRSTAMLTKIRKFSNVRCLAPHAFHRPQNVLDSLWVLCASQCLVKCKVWICLDITVFCDPYSDQKLQGPKNPKLPKLQWL